MIKKLHGSTLKIEENHQQSYNLDTILLADFIQVPKSVKTIYDFGTGSGVLMLYLSRKTKAKIIGIELQESRYSQALKNIEINALTHQVSVLHQDIKDVQEKTVDMIVSNPPFFKLTQGANLSQNEQDLLARHEVALNLESLIQKVSKTLKYGGYFYLIHRPDRLIEIIELMKTYQIEPKQIRFVHPYIDKEANHVLIQAISKGKPGVKVLEPLIIYEKKHVLTGQMQKIYGGDV